MREALRELWRFRELLRQLVARELKVRYKNSVLGFLWSIIPPLLQVLVYTFLFRNVMGVKARNLSAYQLCGLIPWTFFSTAIMDSGQSLLVNYPIIKKVYMPREVIPLSVVISNFVHFLLGWVVYAGAFFVVLPFFGLGIPVLWRLLLFPFATLMLLLLVTGMSLWISILNLFYQDIRYIVQTLFNLLMFALPIIYPADNIKYIGFMKEHPWAFHLYMLNPITAIIDFYRKIILEPVPPGTMGLTGEPLLWTDNLATFLGSCVITVVIAYGGYWYFNYRKWEVVERW